MAKQLKDGNTFTHTEKKAGPNGFVQFVFADGSVFDSELPVLSLDPPELLTISKKPATAKRPAADPGSSKRAYSAAYHATIKKMRKEGSIDKETMANEARKAGREAVAALSR